MEYKITVMLFDGVYVPILSAVLPLVLVSKVGTIEFLIRILLEVVGVR